MADASSTHWEDVYSANAPDAVSWYEPRPDHSLELIERVGLPPDAAIIDVGGGASALAAELVAAGYRDVTVADISETALETARRSAGDAVSWVVADVRDHDFGRQYDLWHDRALLHFMVETKDLAAYMRTLRRSLRPGGTAVIATFGPDGPDQCSRLPVHRYGQEELAAALGAGFRTISATIATHTTPAGNPQQFLYLVAERDPRLVTPPR